MIIQIENRQLSRSARAAHKKKQEHEKLQAQYRELEASNRALAMHVKAFNTLQHSEVTEAVVFTSVDNDSASWTNLSEDKKAEIKEAMQLPQQKILYRQEVKDFLPCGVDIKVTVRSGASPESILDNLYQLLQSIHSTKQLILFRSREPSYVIFNPNDGQWYHAYGPNVEEIGA